VAISDPLRSESVSDRVFIERRFRGPPDSAQGGYACGLVAERINGDCAAVSLRLPPPLERPLDIQQGDEGKVNLLDGDRLVAEGGPADLRLDVPDPVSPGEAQRASARCRWVDRHPFPGCFGCGPQRSQDEAVAIMMGPVADHDLFAGPWTPLAEFAGDDGTVTPLFAWAALDCPTAAAAVLENALPSVLGRLTGRLLAPIRAQRPHTVVAWSIDHDGRKHRGGAAIHGPDGELCAYSEGLWIELAIRRRWARAPSAQAGRPASALVATSPQREGSAVRVSYGGSLALLCKRSDHFLVRQARGPLWDPSLGRRASRAGRRTPPSSTA
jgi:hypothetical protein